MVPRRNVSHFVLSKLFACYLFVAGIALAGFFLWSHQQLDLQHQTAIEQLQNGFIDIIEQSDKDLSEVTKSLALGLQFSKENGVPIESVSLLSLIHI